MKKLLTDETEYNINRLKTSCAINHRKHSLSLDSCISKVRLLNGALLLRGCIVSL